MQLLTLQIIPKNFEKAAGDISVLLFVLRPFCVDNGVLIVKIDPYREGKWAMKPNSY